MIHDGLNTEDTSIRSFLMIGQSNMAGRGEFNDVAPIENPDCYMLRIFGLRFFDGYRCIY